MQCDVGTLIEFIGTNLSPIELELNEIEGEMSQICRSKGVVTFQLLPWLVGKDL